MGKGDKNSQIKSVNNLAQNTTELFNTILKKEFTTTPVNDLNDNKKWYKTWNGEILIVGNIYKINSEFCVYAGDFKYKEEVPLTFCCFTMGDTLRVRHVKANANSETELPLKERRKRTDDDRPIDTTSKDADNALMLFIKAALQFKNITRGDFRRLYPNLSDMNNILRCIEKGDNLSWRRFTELIDKLNVIYHLDIFDNESGVKITSTQDD
jgi:hypothetical protein